MVNKSILTVVLSTLIFFIGCRIKNEESKYQIVIKGSDTMVNLSQSWAEEYMKLNRDVSIQITGGGSATGIAALINNSAEIANSSRELTNGELKKAAEAGLNPELIKAALDGVAVIVNASNKVDTVTLAELRDLYNGRIKNWKELGGDDVPVVLYGRESSSGTHQFFKEHMLTGIDGKAFNYDNSTQFLQGTSAIGKAVANDYKGIGYGGLGYFVNNENIKILAIKADDNSQAVLPIKHGQVDYDVIWDGGYPLARWLYLVKDKDSEKELEDFVDFTLSRQGQKIVKDMEFIPVPQ